MKAPHGSLLTGSYTRVPRCIRDRIVPPEPITALERRQVLLRLNQVIEHRLVTSDLPLQMRNLKIENGLVTFFVEHEFEAVLTLMGEGPSVPWRLLKVHVLVSDKETGEGKPLMHSMQLRYMEQLVQSREGSFCRVGPILNHFWTTFHFSFNRLKNQLCKSSSQINQT